MLNKDLTAATIRPAVLAILAERESYGYEIIKEVYRLSDQKIEWAEGALYPMLHRLERLELIESYWKTASNGRKRKYYKLRAQGQKELEKQKSEWSTASALMTKLLGPKPCLT